MIICCCAVQPALLCNGAGAITLGLWFILWTAIGYRFELDSLAWQLDEGVLRGARLDATDRPRSSSEQPHQGLKVHAKAKRPGSFPFRPRIPWLGGLVERWPNAFEPDYSGRLENSDGESDETDESGNRHSVRNRTLGERRSVYKRNLERWAADVTSDATAVAIIRLLVAAIMIVGGVAAVLTILIVG